MMLDKLKPIIESALLSVNEPLTVEQLQRLLFTLEDKPEIALIRDAVKALQQDYNSHVLELVQVANGYRFQIKSSFSSYVRKLHEKRPPRYSRALLETLALIAYRQPITRGEVESVRGVSTSTHIFKTLLERTWVKIIGYKNVPGKPALYGTTKQFLSYFNLKNLSDLPPLKAWVNEDQVEDQLAQLGLSLDSDEQGPLLPIPVPITDPDDK